MGTDIHLYAEVKLKNEWYCIRNYDEHLETSALTISTRAPLREGDLSGVWWNLSGRNYRLFAALAGVRGEGPKPKGLPHDVSAVVRMYHDEWGSEIHSASWATAEEFFSAYLAVAQVGTERMNKYLQLTLQQSRDIALQTFLLQQCSLPQGCEYRFVFWFDN